MPNSQWAAHANLSSFSSDASYGRARKSRQTKMPQLADAMLCGYGSDAMEDVGTTFEAIPQSIVRDEVL